MIMFMRELRKNIKSFLIWTFIVVLLSVYTVSLFPHFKDQMALVQAKLPSFMQGALGLGQLDTSHILGFYGLVYVDISLLAGIYAMILGSSIISKEESDKTIEFLLAKPVTRTKIVLMKLAAVFVLLLLFNGILSVSNWIGFNAVKTVSFPTATFWLLMAAPLLLQTVFASVGVLLSMFIVKAKSNLPLSVGVVLGTFFIDVLSKLSDQTHFLKYFTPFQYVNSVDIIRDGYIHTVYLLLTLTITVLCLAGSFVLYNRKDIAV